MAAITNYGTRRRHELPNRKPEQFFGTQLVEVSPNQTLHRKSSTLDFIEGLHSSKRTVSQPHTEEHHKDNFFDGSHSPLHRFNLGPSSNNGLASSKTYHPTPNTFFDGDGVMLRERNPMSLQKPISRPSSKFFANDDNSITMNPMAEQQTSSSEKKQFTSKIWNDYEGETVEQDSHLERQNSGPLPKLTTQPEWPRLRHQTGLARANRSLDNHKEVEKVKDKAFVDSLFPGGIDAFVQDNLQKNSIGCDYIKPHLIVPSPPPSPPPVFVGDVSLPETQYPTIMKVMSGKQLIEDLDEYERNEQQRAGKLGRIISTLTLRDQIERNISTHSLHDQVGGNISTQSLRNQFDRNTSTHSLHDQIGRNPNTQSLDDQVDRNTSTQSLRDLVDRNTSTQSLRDLVDRNINTHNLLDQFGKNTSTHSLRDQVGRNFSALVHRDKVDESPAQKMFSNSNISSTSQTLDVHGPKNKGFRRGHEALQVAISEKWACMDRVLNAPLDPVSRDSRFFVIKSNCELDIFASLKHGIWTSTDLGNKRLDRAFCDPTRKGPIFLFFSVSGSGKFCGIAEMTSAIEHSVHTGIWSDKRWRGRFTVEWLNVKDIPNADLRQFRVANNDNKPFTNCRDTQEILINPGESVYNLFSRYVSSSSVFQSSFEEQRCGNDELHQV
ncbi:uncharacterized protein H6S33_010145 [Morchella sextelata]|uniref:uncharacterized protein n=1 Tax=Morchella sextelata TaxID=1174677 RepID=UPI001D03865D|nr:uncharacterized protein H6S33_010145 [Morchella sextelata]KAH0612093.1 hypothetical protein H6S33_010145 [Morchella sextelata]